MLQSCVWRMAAMLVLWVVSAPAIARMQWVKPGEVPLLGPDEGFVVMAVDTAMELQRVSLNKDGKVFGSGSMTGLAPGRSFRLYVAQAGDYSWKRIEVFSNYAVRFSFDLEDSDEYRFKVEPGRVNYPGDLLFRPTGAGTADIGMVNRSLAALDWIGQEHPALRQVPFAYAGHYPDPFPAFYREALKGMPSGVAAAPMPPPPEPHGLAVDPAVMFKDSQLVSSAINPRGDLVALQLRDAPQRWQVSMIDLKTGESYLAATSPEPFSLLQWDGDDTLLFSVVPPEGQTITRALRTSAGADGKRQWTVLKLPAGGWVVDPLVDDPDHVFYVSPAYDGRPMVYPLKIVSQKTIDSARPRFAERLNIGLEGDVGWLIDGGGAIRLAVVRKDDDYLLMYRRHGKFEQIMALSDLSDFEPVGLSKDAGTIYALTDRDRPQRELVAYDVEAGRIVKTLYSRPGVDVHSAVFGSGAKLLGARYYEGGHLLTDYFDAADARLLRSLQAALPGRNVLVADRSHDGTQVLVMADSADQPAQLYHLDASVRSMSLLAEDRPWIDARRLAPTSLLRLQGADGLPIEAFLTLPPGTAKRPLIVFPHGGPVGVADSLAFDPDTQFLASLGYAVLRVNFRGSAGYGRAFREAGKAGFGTLIEDDIDAALRKALAEYPVDAQRMCVVGASYGGYSAMVMAMRWPGRFRCVASISGVADRLLFYTASDGARTEKGRAQLEKALGDPNTEAEAMRETSPLYHYDRIRIPVMLAHGLEDRRVDYEHTRRMGRMLGLAGNPPVGLSFEEGGHSLAKVSEQVTLWRGIAGFLQAHLGAGEATAPSQ